MSAATTSRRETRSTGNSEYRAPLEKCEPRDCCPCQKPCSKTRGREDTRELGCKSANKALQFRSSSLDDRECLKRCARRAFHRRARRSQACLRQTIASRAQPQVESPSSAPHASSPHRLIASSLIRVIASSPHLSSPRLRVSYTRQSRPRP